RMVPRGSCPFGLAPRSPTARAIATSWSTVLPSHSTASGKPRRAARPKSNSAIPARPSRRALGGVVSRATVGAVGAEGATRRARSGWVGGSGWEWRKSVMGDQRQGEGSGLDADQVARDEPEAGGPDPGDERRPHLGVGGP